jgi:hypothetical protein
MASSICGDLRSLLIRGDGDFPEGLLRGGEEEGCLGGGGLTVTGDTGRLVVISSPVGTAIGADCHGELDGPGALAVQTGNPSGDKTRVGMPC